RHEGGRWRIGIVALTRIEESLSQDPSSAEYARITLARLVAVRTVFAQPNAKPNFSRLDSKYTREQVGAQASAHREYFHHPAQRTGVSPQAHPLAEKIKARE